MAESISAGAQWRIDVLQARNGASMFWNIPLVLI
jgi:hypothetical protein